MEHFKNVLLAIWKEACRHIRIEQSVATMSGLLAREMPLSQVVVGKFVFDPGTLTTMALGMTGAVFDAPFPSRIPLEEDSTEKIISWCTSGRVRLDDLPASLRPFLLPVLNDVFNADAHVLAGPLAAGDAMYGLLLLISKPGAAFTKRHQNLSETVLEPFSVALRNDAVLREMEKMREAAEADKRKLLTRLGRKKFGDRVVGDDSGLATVMQRVSMAAPLEVPVMIFGETGSGKELMARAIHNSSPRSANAFIRVNCGAIPPSLIDSELFGHEKGAFTGAVADRKGWFERADGGTLFLDEIGDLPHAAQVRLLRVLQDGWMERVGGHRPIHVDVRIVGATHRDLAAMVKSGAFREDLWYRLMVFPIIIPPLRDRVEDIPEMARHFARRAATRFGLQEVMPDKQAVALLKSYDWPGNVREFAAVMDRAAILGNGASLDVESALGIGAGVEPAPETGSSRSTISKKRHAEESVHFPSLDDMITQHIQDALRKSKGRIEGDEGAAALLRLHPSTLRAKLRKFGLSRTDYEA